MRFFRFHRKSLLNFRRLFLLFGRYKHQLILGTVSAFAVSLLNLVGIGAFAPLIDLLSATKESQEEWTAQPQPKVQPSSATASSPSSAKPGKALFALDEKDLQLISTCEQKFLLELGRCIAYPLKIVQQKLSSFMRSLSLKEQFLYLGATIVLANLLKIVFLLATVYLVGMSVQRVSRDLRLASFRRLLHLPIGYFQRRHTGTMINRVVGDSENISMVLGAEFSELFVNLFYIITHLTFLLLISWKTLLLLTVIALILNQPVLIFIKKVSQITKNKLEHLGVLSAATYEIVSGIRIIRSFGKEKESLHRYAKLTNSVADQSLRGHYYSAVSPSLVEVGSTLLFLFFLIIGSRLIGEGQEGGFTHGTLFAFLLGLLFILGPLKRLSVSVNSVTISLKIIERIFKFIGQPTDAMYRLQSKSPSQPFPQNFLSIELKNVWGGYRSRKSSTSPTASGNISHTASPTASGTTVPQTQTQTQTKTGKESLAIRRMNIAIQNGEKIGLVGRSGAGKSTLIDMMIGFLQPEAGAISFLCANKKKKELAQISLRDRARFLSAVFQEPFLFHGTIRENVLYFLHAQHAQPAQQAEQAHSAIPKSPILENEKGNRSDERLDEVARHVMMHDVIHSFPLKYDTTVGERGMELSGGQRQRIVLMRVFLQNPKILFLDEATSHLDAETERKVFENLYRELPQATMLISSHRLESIRFLDRFFVLDNGELVEEGSHDELMKRRGIYFELYLQQSASSPSSSSVPVHQQQQ